MAEKDRILVIDSDPNELSLLVEAVLEPFGYDVLQAIDGSTGLAMALEAPPDLILMSLELDTLSGKDVIAAISAQSIDVPIIVITGAGEEATVIRAFRLGAKDYLARPLRDTEVIAATERALKEVRLQRERKTLAAEIQGVNRLLEQRIRELETLTAIGKRVTAMTNLEQLFERVVQAAVMLTQADTGGFLLREEGGDALILRAGHNLERQLLDRLGKPMTDDLTQLVMSSGETFLASGEGLRRFHPLQEAHAVIYAPLMVQDNPLGVLWVGNARRAFEEHQRSLMTALADYVAIAVANARLFAAMEHRSRQLEAMYKQAQQAAPSPGVEAEQAEDAPPFVEAALDFETIQQFREALYDLRGDMVLLQTGEMGDLEAAQQASVDVIARKLGMLIEHLDSIAPPGADL